MVAVPLLVPPTPLASCPGSENGTVSSDRLGSAPITDSGQTRAVPPSRTAVVVTALEVEALAAKEHLRDIREDVHANGTVYLVGRFGDGPSSWRVAVVVAGAGNPTAAMELERAITHFQPQVVLLVGVAGGIKDVTLGDVVAADKVYGYERGKAEAEFHPRPDAFKSAYALVQRARIEASNGEWRKRIFGGPGRTLPRAFVGPIAAGEKVIAAHDSPVYAFLRASYSDALAVEMEGAGFLAAAHANQDVRALVVRGISDLVEGKAAADAQGGQMAAARNAAAFAYELLSSLSQPASREEEERRLQRVSRCDRLLRESRARCIERFQGAGLPVDVAAKLSDDPAVGAVPPTLLPTRERPVTILIGEFGSGKSLACERMYQDAVRRALVDAEALIPIYVEAFPNRLPTLGDLRASASELGDADKCGIALFLERCDEAGQEHALNCLSVARRVVAMWPESEVVMPSRPLPALDDLAEAIEMPPLDTGYAAQLVATAGAESFDEHDLLRWSGAMHDAARRPFFAIALGLYLREQDAHGPFPTTGELIGSLVRQSLRRARIDAGGATKALRRIASATTDGGGAPVDVRGIGGLLGDDALFRTGLVSRHGEKVGFAVPVVGQWFAAQAILEGEVDVASLVQERRRSSHWRYPMSIVAASGRGVVVHRLMGQLASQDPGLAAVVLNDSVRRTFTTLGAPAPATLHFDAETISAAWRSWLDGLGALAPFVHGVNELGLRYDVRPEIKEGQIVVRWFDPSVPQRGPVPGDESPALALVSSSHAGGGDPIEPWRMLHEAMRRDLAESVREKRFPITLGDPLAAEAVWAAALALTARGSLYPFPVPLAEIESALAKIHPSRRRVHCHGRGMVDVVLVSHWVHELRSAGVEQLHSPHPAADIPYPTEHSVWSMYSDERLLERTRSVYEAAIAGYIHVVRTWFGAFAQRLSHALILPAKFVGVLESPVKGDGANTYGPGLDYVFQPLPRDRTSVVEINVAAGDSPSFSRQLEHERWQVVEAQRGEATQWIQGVSGSRVLDIFGPCPATDLAYDWLRQDLRHIHWA